jgi:hypothetical protein
LLPLLTLGSSCEKKSEESSSSGFGGVFSMSMNLSAVDASDGNYQAEYTAGYNLGMRGAQTVISWCTENTDYNYAPAVYLSTNSGYGLTRLSSQGFKILVTIPIVAITTKCAPPRVAADAFNTAAMKAAYRAFLDQILPYIDSNVLYVSFGNEVDDYFATHSSEWSAFKELIEDAGSYVKASRPWVKVGVTTTFKGASGSYQSEVQTLNQNMDVFILTYYPHPGNFVMQEPTVVENDMATAVTLAGSKPLIYQEFGYPTHADLNASESKQWQFFDLGLSKWRAIGASTLPFLSAFKRRDYFNNVASCGAGGTNANKFLCSLGLTNNDQTAKTAWTNLQSKLTAIGVP